MLSKSDITASGGTIIVVAPECISGQRLLECAHAIGYRVVSAVVAPSEQDSYLRWCLVTAPGRQGPCDRLIWCSDYESLLKELSGEKNIVAVITGSEFGVEIADRLAAHFGVRGNSPDNSSARRNKLAMKHAIAAAGLDYAKGGLFSTPEEAVSFVHKELAYPVVAKPPDSAGSTNVFICSDEAELVKSVERILGTHDGYGKVPNNVVVEEFIPGEELAVNLFADEEKLVVTSIWRYERSSTSHWDSCYWNDYIQDPDDPAFAELCAYAKRLYRAVGIRLGSAHAEIKLSPRGPVAIEIGSRIMGSASETFGDAGMRLDIPMENVKVFTTGRSDVPAVPRLHERLGLATLPYVTGGVVTAVRGLDVIRALPTYLCEEMEVQPGDRISPSTCLDECRCGVWLKAATEIELVRDLEIVHDVFKVETV